MSDEPPQNANPGGDGDEPKKRRRRRRRSKNKPRQDGSPNPAEPSAKADANPTPADDSGVPREKRDAAQERPRSKPRSNDRKPKAGDGYRGKNQNASQDPNARSSGPKRDSNANPGNRNKPAAPKPAGGPAASEGSVGKAPDRPGNAASKPKAKKRRKPRTKQCVHCYTPCTTIHRVRIDYRKQWVFVCDICWPTRCIDNPHYEFGGTWVSGRIVKPESQLRDEWLAKQNQKPSNPKPRADRPDAHDKPSAHGHDAQVSAQQHDPSHSADQASTATTSNRSDLPTPPVQADEAAIDNAEATLPDASPPAKAGPPPQTSSNEHAVPDPPTEESQGS